MNGLPALLLLLCEVSAPLGPYARPGVPVPLLVTGEERIVVEGWTYRGDELTLIHPPYVPCVVRDGAGRELLRLEALPEGVRLVATLRDARAGENERVVAARLEALGPEHWRCLDVFDSVELDAPVAAAWTRAGGGLVPRIGNVLPEVYDRIERPAGASPAQSTARLIVLACAAVLAAQLLLRRNLAPLAAVSLLGGLLGWFAPAFEPARVSRIEVVYHLKEATRWRVFVSHTSVGPPAAVIVADDATPIFYRSASEPWWTGTKRECRLEKGVFRLFCAEKLLGPSAGPGPGGRGALAGLVERLSPRRGRWSVEISERTIAFTSVD